MLVPPTRVNLGNLVTDGTVAEAMRPRPVTPLTLRPVNIDGSWQLELT